jgi:capsular exopolysaccharide synthesis family protein
MNDAGKLIESARPRHGPKKIGAIMADMGLITQQQISFVLETMNREGGVLFGETCARLKLLTGEDVARALALQYSHDYIGDEADQVPIALESVRHPFGAHAYQIRSVRNFLIRNWFSSERKSLAIVGVNSGAGVSTFAAGLAISFAQTKMETLLVDGDLRRGIQRELFCLKDRQGLSDTLATNGGLQRISRIAQCKGLSVLPSGTVFPNAFELLSQPAYPTLCDLLRDRFDVVLIDTPAFGIGHDALETAAVAGAALVVVQKNVTSTNALQALKHNLTAQGTAIVGYVLNDFI